MLKALQQALTVILLASIHKAEIPMTNKKVFFKLMLFLGVMGILIFSEEVLAATSSSTIFERAYYQLYETFAKARVVVYITAGFGLVGFATAAIFGKLSIRWLAMIAIALFTLAAAEKVVKYAVDSGSNSLTSTFVSEVNDADFRLDVGGSSTDFSDYNGYYHEDRSSLSGS